MALPNFSSIAKSVTSFAQGTSIPKSGGTAFDLLNPANARRLISGLPLGGGAALSKIIPNIGFSGGVAGGGGPSLYDYGTGDLKAVSFAPVFGSKKATSTQKFTSIVSTTRVPTASTVSVTLRPVYSRKNLHDRFNLNDFAQGKLIGTKDFGGFL